jgi:hypothetical protein
MAHCEAGNSEQRGLRKQHEVAVEVVACLPALHQVKGHGREHYARAQHTQALGQGREIAQGLDEFAHARALLLVDRIQTSRA